MSNKTIRKGKDLAVPQVVHPAHQKRLALTVVVKPKELQISQREKSKVADDKSNLFLNSITNYAGNELPRTVQGSH